MTLKIVAGRKVEDSRIRVGPQPYGSPLHFTKVTGASFVGAQEIPSRRAVLNGTVQTHRHFHLSLLWRDLSRQHFPDFVAFAPGSRVVDQSVRVFDDRNDRALLLGNEGTVDQH